MFVAQTATVSLPNSKQIKAQRERQEFRKKKKEKKKGIPNSTIQVTATVTPALSRKGSKEEEEEELVIITSDFQTTCAFRWFAESLG